MMYSDCDHQFERDLIDIDPDRSQMVYTCSNCGYMTTEPERTPSIETKQEKDIIQPKPIKITYRDFVYDSNLSDEDDDYMIGDTPIPCTNSPTYMTTYTIRGLSKDRRSVDGTKFARGGTPYANDKPGFTRFPSSQSTPELSQRKQFRIDIWDASLNYIHDHHKEYKEHAVQKMVNTMERNSTKLVNTKPKRWREIIYEYICRLTRLLRRKSTPPPTTPSPVTTASISSSRTNYIPLNSSPSPDIESALSGYSSISYENECDIQSIHIQQDIQDLSTIEFEDTTIFTPNIKYGKVLQVLSPREIVVASRIYNGYTKVLRPKLYRFYIKLSNVKHYDMNENKVKEKLTTMILDKIVVIEKLYIHPDTNIMYADVYLSDIHINKYVNDTATLTL